MAKWQCIICINFLPARVFNLNFYRVAKEEEEWHATNDKLNLRYQYLIKKMFI